VTLSVRGRFHAFNLASQLDRRGQLERLITTYPTYGAEKYGVPKARICSLLAHEVAYRGWHRLPAAVTSRLDLRFLFQDAFDAAAQRHIPNTTNVYLAWSSVAEWGIARARQLGAVTIVERGSSHIEYQRDVLQEEYERWGGARELPHPAIVEKEKREYALADYISVPSTFARQTFLDRGFPARKLITVPYGVDLYSFQPLPRRDEVFRVIFAGSMSLRKGVHYLLRAFSELRLSNAELWLVGPKLPEIEPFFRLYEGSYRYFGRLPQGKLCELYSQCSVFAICSIEEGMATVQPQAMACGLPLICTTNTGGADLIEDGVEGFVLPIRDVDALKESILYLHQNSDDCLQMGQRARLRACSALTWDDYGAAMSRAFERALEEARGVRSSGNASCAP